MGSKNSVIEVKTAAIRRALSDTAMDEEAYESMLENIVLNGDPYLTYREAKEALRLIRSRTRSNLGILDKYVRNPEIKEIMVNGEAEIFLETGKGMEKAPERFDSVEEIEEIMRNIAAAVHREINEMNPILDARLSDGSRVNAVYKNIAVGGPAITIRKFSKEHITLEQIRSGGGITAECAEALQILVAGGYNIFISGGTSSGKTTFLNALADSIPAEERVIVIEDSRELMLRQIDNIVQMECHNANTVGKGQVTMDMLIRTSLRMRPDRIIVGEVRGSEVAEMLQAMNTGHDGCISTGHGNSVTAMLRRLEYMYMMASEVPLGAIRGQIVEGIDIMLHMSRLADGRRVVTEVQELCGYEGDNYQLNPLFLYGEEGTLQRTGNRLQSRTKLMTRGLDRNDRL
ncbi:CpaF family protein [Eubacterium sp. AB3007]|uniref:CpaF family protein n=1 Tax=Eubacterium sp. AB3007 TaxID=1392487 RepID=UPI000AC9E5B4|nr:ATPase, T2SS/T4P/T4SS family [Eubacterium sp. AB3007]